MQIAMKIKQRCLVCKNKIKKKDVILIKRNGIVIHEECMREARRKLSGHA